MDTSKKSDDLARAIRHFTVVVTETLQGRDLSTEQAVYYQAHPKEWHGRMFDALMTSLTEARMIFNIAMGVILQNATKVPALRLNEALRFPCIFGPDLEKVADCWEVDKNLSYEQFGTKFEFPPPLS
jgi:hypothetical protein